MPNNKALRPPCIPLAPRAIQKGMSLADLLGVQAVECLALNLLYVMPEFDSEGFIQDTVDQLTELSLMQRGKLIAHQIFKFLDTDYAAGLQVLLASLTDVVEQADEFGLAGFFYLPHSFFISEFGLNPTHNKGDDPFDSSMDAMLELTLRFTSEFAIRDFLIADLERTLSYVEQWQGHSNPHVRRLCSEGTRPRLPWGKRIPALVTDPTPVIPILQRLKNDPSLYVRRSVANHLGDIAKAQPDLVFSLCDQWLEQGASNELKWLIRHALRHPAKKQNEHALALRVRAK